MIKNIVIIPDSFKGCLSSREVGTIIKNAIHEIDANININQISISDGGEGLVDCFINQMGGHKVRVKTTGPLFTPIESFYGMIDYKTAIIEMAASAGLHLVKKQANPSLTTTYGVGELIKHAINNGAKTIILGLGGSATNDAGVGMAAALGATFYNKDQKSFIPVGNTLCEITKIDISPLSNQVKNINFVTLCDVNNPLYGLQGAAHVFAKQKGADDQMVKLLDENLQYYSKLLQTEFQFDSNFAGAGAAGGTTVAAKLFLHSQIKSGIKTFLEMIAFQETIRYVDCIITGEGKFDSQSLQGKVIDGIAKYAANGKIPLYAIVGQNEILDQLQYPLGLKEVIAISDFSLSLEDAIKNAPIYIKKAVKHLFSKL